MKKAKKLSDIAARFAPKQEIRIDDRHTIKLKTSRWFPEMVLLTGILATAGTWMYGRQIGSETSFSTKIPGKPVAEKSVKAAKALKKAKIAEPKLTAAPRPVPSTNPRIIDAKTNIKAITLDIASAKIVGDEAVITYRIFNSGKEAATGTTWAEGTSLKPTDKITWKARNFTVKSVSVPVAELKKSQVKIHVNDTQANAVNTYMVRF